jgi:predicted amidohydrolase
MSGRSAVRQQRGSEFKEWSMGEVTLSLVQMDCEVAAPERNFARAELFVTEAARRGSDLVLLPELWSTAYALERAREFASPLVSGEVEGNWFGRLAGMARRNGVWLAGSILEERDGKQTNCLTVYSPDGELAAAYRKVHLFRLMQEEQYLGAGNELVTVQLPWGRAGLAICYDLRFPEMFRRYAMDGAEMMIIPAEWPNPRREHWRTLLRARAIENQCFVLGCNRVGETRGSTFFGASAVVGPWGEALVEGGNVEGILTVTVDPAQTAEARRKIPVFDDRRTDLYG